jgi:hypothetical protein
VVCTLDAIFLRNSAPLHTHQARKTGRGNDIAWKKSHRAAELMSVDTKMSGSLQCESKLARAESLAPAPTLARAYRSIPVLEGEHSLSTHPKTLRRRDRDARPDLVVRHDCCDRTVVLPPDGRGARSHGRLSILHRGLEPRGIPAILRRFWTIQPRHDESLLSLAAGPSDTRAPHRLRARLLHVHRPATCY